MPRIKKVEPVKPFLRYTEFQIERARQVGKMIQKGIDPFHVQYHSSNCAYRFKYEDIACYLELSLQPFSQTVSCYKLEGSEDSLKRKPIFV